MFIVFTTCMYAYAYMFIDDKSAGPLDYYFFIHRTNHEINTMYL